MATRTKFYTRFRSSRTHQLEQTIKKISIIILNIDQNQLKMNDPQVEVKIFTKYELDQYVDYIITKITNIYLFISSHIADRFIPLVHNCSQIKSIYIFDNDKQYQNYLYAKEKVQGPFQSIYKTLKQFNKNISLPTGQCYPQLSRFQIINEESAQGLWWKVLDKILQNLKHTNIAREEFILFSKESFQDDELLLKQIEDFKENYTSDKAIYWYTRPTFLHRFINRILRTRKNLNKIFKFRLFLTDLIAGLEIAQLNIKTYNLYRAAIISNEELQQLKSAEGNLIFFNQFLSASMDKDVAKTFAGYSVNHPFKQSALFTIKIDPCNINRGTTPFADIRHHGCVPCDGEVLLSMHSTFRVQSVEFDGTDHFWNIYLELMDNIWNINFGERSIFSPHADQIFIRNLSKENKQFIAFQLLLDIILRLDQNIYAKQELIEFCQTKYQNNPAQLNQIDDFKRNYRSEDAAKWYTKESFLYRLLNESLRIEIIDHIVKMRYFIHDLHNQLAQLQPSFIQSLNGKLSLTLYRGQTMKINGLNEIRENYGGLISMNSFLSATQEEDVAVLFSGNGEMIDPNEVSIIYEMLINTNIRSTPFAKIESVMENEEEILFSMGSVFRIGDVKMARNRVYYVKLTMTHTEDELWNKLTAHLD